MLQLLQELKDKALKCAKLTQGQVLQKIEERNAARKNKEYERSHTIRKDLAAVGIALMDGPDGTAWRPSYHIFTSKEQMKFILQSIMLSLTFNSYFLPQRAV
ncbi:hypothetical protein ACFX13_044436 [Malus domestica]